MIWLRTRTAGLTANSQGRNPEFRMLMKISCRFLSLKLFLKGDSKTALFLEGIRKLDVWWM